MNEERNLLTEASNLLEDLEPILRKSIDSLYYDLNSHKRECYNSYYSKK